MIMIALLEEFRSLGCEGADIYDGLTPDGVM